MKTISIFCLFIFSAFQIPVTAQIQSFDFVLMPHSVSSFGMGEQGVALLTNDDALVYNPAKLTLTKNTRVSFFRNPLQVIGAGPFPVTNISVYHNITNIGSFGLSYEKQDWGVSMLRSPANPGGTGEKFHFYETAFSVGYARKISSNLSLGAELKYAYEKVPDYTVNGLFISFGLLYNPEFFDKRFTLGFSLMNLGTAVKFETTYEPEINGPEVKNTFYYSPPSQLNFGLNFIASENEYFVLPVNLSFSKPFDKTNENLEGQSSFKSLFNDWSDFPRDASMHTGIAFQWKPLNVGKDFSFIQEFYLGDYSRGPKSGGFYNFFTHGANIGLGYKGFKFTMGYAGVAHNVQYQYPGFLPWEFPYETFQFALELNDNILFKKNETEEIGPALNKIILSLGYGLTARVGKYKYTEYGFSTENSPNYSIESAFYFSNDNALVSSLHYNSVPYNLSFGGVREMMSKFESVSVFSSYRYHPAEDFHYLYIQGGMGIYRLNPVQEITYPRYDYKIAFQLSTGLLLDFLTPFIIMPVIDYNLILFPTRGAAPRISGNNQVNVLLKIGYVFL